MILPLEAKGEKEKSPYIVEGENIWFTYPTGKDILKNLSLKIAPGTFTVLMGENGAGKTTLLKILNGLLKPDRGRLRLLGEDTKHKSVESFALQVAYLSQDPGDYLFLPTVREEMNFTIKNLGLTDQGIGEEIAQRLGIITYLDQNPGI